MIDEPKRTEKFYGLDHLRALAIFLVFFFHYQNPIFDHPEWLPDYVKFGWTGVDLFFVLSGFLISSQLFENIKKGKKISYKQFFLKRFFRIIPAYVAVVALYFLIPLFREKESLPPIWKFLTFTQNFGLNLKDSGTFSHAWSLCVEEHFYFFLPMILILLQTFNLLKKSYWLLIGLFLVGFALRIYSWDYLFLPKTNSENPWLYWYQFVYYPTYNRLDGLLTGVSIAAVYQFLPDFWNRISKFGNVSVVSSIAVLALAYRVCDDGQSFYASVFGFPLVSIGYGLLIVGAISPTSFLYKWKSKTTGVVAALSFAIYLTHKGVIHVTQKLLGFANVKIDSNLMMIICILTCVISAYAMHLSIEKPFMKMRNRFIRHQ